MVFTLYIGDLNKLSFIWWFDYRHELIFVTAFSKILVISNVFKINWKIIYLVSFPRLSVNICDTYKLDEFTDAETASKETSSLFHFPSVALFSSCFGPVLGSISPTYLQ